MTMKKEKSMMEGAIVTTVKAKVMPPRAISMDNVGGFQSSSLINRKSEENSKHSQKASDKPLEAMISDRKNAEALNLNVNLNLDTVNEAQKRTKT